MSPATKAQIGRVLRLTVFTLASSALVVNAVDAWEARYPLIGLGLGLLEALYRVQVPTVPAPPAGPESGGSSSP